MLGVLPLAPLTAMRWTGVQSWVPWGASPPISQVRLFRRPKYMEFIVSWSLLRVTLVAGCLVGLSLSVGCDKPDAKSGTSAAAGHDHSHSEASEPKSLSEALEQLEKLRVAIKDAFDKNDPEAADDPLHDVVHLLDHLPELVGKLTLDDATKAEAGKAIDAVNKAFEGLHDGMHGGTNGKKYSDVAESLEGALKSLAGLPK